MPVNTTSLSNRFGDAVLVCQTVRNLIRMGLYKMVVAYNGFRFCGFQRQMNNEEINQRGEQYHAAQNRPTKRPHYESDGRMKKPNNSITVQDCLEDAIMATYTQQKWTVDDIVLRFAGRTDSGVHARGQVIAVKLPEVAERWSTDEIRKSMNSRLPCDISVQSVDLCPSAVFDPRRDVKRKQYSYTIKYRRKVYTRDGQLLPICTLGPHLIRDAFDSHCLWVCPWPLNDTKLAELCDYIQGHHDFKVFVHKHDRNVRNHVFTIDRFCAETLEETNEIAPIVTLRFLVEAEGFRRSMIRNLVGFCVDVCRGAEAVASMELAELWTGSELVASKIHAAPASGLCLEEVSY